MRLFQGKYNNSDWMQWEPAQLLPMLHFHFLHFQKPCLFFNQKTSGHCLGTFIAEKYLCFSSPSIFFYFLGFVGLKRKYCVSKDYIKLGIDCFYNMAFKYQCLRGVFWIFNWERRKYEEVLENQRTLLCSICVPAITWRDSGIPRKSNMTMWTHCTNQLSLTW